MLKSFTFLKNSLYKITNSNLIYNSQLVNSGIYRGSRCYSLISVNSFKFFSGNIESQQQQQEDYFDKYQITITDKCIEQLKKLNKEANATEIDKKKLRVMVDTGGCSGYQYILKVVDSKETLTEDDILFKKDNEDVIIDKLSLDMMTGSVIDYETSLMRSSFCVSSNPNTIKSCGCKVSFDLKKK